jgi:type I site-specific restriction-modification system R (restriction) subunit
MKATKNSKRVEHLEPELEKMEEKYSREKDRLGKVFGIAEELDNDLRLAVTEMKARDDWYVDHMQIFEDLNKAIKERYEMIERAVESERKSQHMSRVFSERVEEMVQARSEEMVEDEAETAEAEEATAAVEVVEEAAPEEASVEEPAEEEAPEEEAEAPAEEAAGPTEWGDAQDPWATE